MTHKVINRAYIHEKFTLGHRMSNIKLNAIIKMNDFTDVEDDYEIEIDQEWFKEILTLMETEVQTEPMPEHKGDLYAHLHIKKLKNSAYKDHLVIKGRITSAYTGNCVRCLRNTDGEFDADFSAVYLHNHFEDSDEFKETTHIFCDGQEMELCFHNKGDIDLKELLYDQAFMNLDHLPLHDEECKGLCQSCGIDFNEDSCECKIPE